MKKLIYVILSITYLLSGKIALAEKQNVSLEEKKILSVIKTNTENQVSLVRDMVNVNTATNNAEGIQHDTKILQTELKKLQFQTWTDDSPKQFGRAPHLFAKYEASQKNAPTLLLLGHLDTVYPAHHKGKFERNGDALKGPGIIDMKAGNATIIYALKALAETNNLNKYNIYVAFTSDEEISGAAQFDVTRKALQDIARKSDYVIEFEPASDPNEAAIGIRNYVFWKVSVSGIQGHSSKIMGSELGAGAIYEIARIADQFRQKTDFKGGISTNIGTIAGGTHASSNTNTYKGTFEGKSNITPSMAEIIGDTRALSDQQAITQLKKYEQITKAPLQKTSAKFTYVIENPAMPITEGNKQLLTVYSGSSRDLGYGEVKAGDPRKQVATDISFVGPLVKKGALSRIGPYGQGMHSGINETTTIADIQKATEKAAIMIYRLNTP